MSDFSKEYIENLPDCYKKTEDSNNYKILQIERSSMDDVSTDIQAILDITDINKATGKTLDLYGDMVSQPRGMATDAQYLYMIRAKMFRNLAGGSYSDITGALCNTFNCDPNQVYIEESSDPASVNVITLPLPIIIGAGFTAAQTMLLIQAMLPICIEVHMYRFDGTFTFSDSLNESSIAEGFADDNQTTGGYFGLLSSDDNEVSLPI